MSEIEERFVEMWRKSRYDSGLSQEEVARRLGVSRRTVQNWEDGLSSPSQLMGFKWFKALGLPPLPYYLEVLYPDFYENRTRGEKEVLAQLTEIIKGCTPADREKLLFILSGAHGSSPEAVLDLVVAHLQCPIRERIGAATQTVALYKLCEQLGELSQPSGIRPDTEKIETAINKAAEAVRKGNSGYTIRI